MTPTNLSEAEIAERKRVGATLRMARTTRGWKLGDLANAVDISYAYLSNIEAGRKPLTDVLLARIAKTLDVEQIAIKTPAGAAA